MGNDGVSELYPDSEGGGGASPAPSYAYTRAFEKAFPYYLSIGMSYEQFWHDDVELVKFYREAWRIRREAKNQELWLQGAYIYEAILDAAPALHPFAKKGTKPIPYRSEPYELGSARREEATRQEKEQRADNRAKAMMEIFMVNINRKFEKKGGEENGG